MTFAAGEGVGTVTKPGLQIRPGEPAINPVPRQMIAAAVQEALAAASPGDCPDFPGANDVARNIRDAAAKMGLSPLGAPGTCAERPFSPKNGPVPAGVRVEVSVPGGREAAAQDIQSAAGN